MRISDWSSDVCSSDLGLILDEVVERPASVSDLGGAVLALGRGQLGSVDLPVGGRHTLCQQRRPGGGAVVIASAGARRRRRPCDRQGESGRMVRRYPARPRGADRSEEHTSELQSLMRISYAVFCLTKKNTS